MAEGSVSIRSELGKRAFAGEVSTPPSLEVSTPPSLEVSTPPSLEVSTPAGLGGKLADNQ